jgi:ABC-type transport system substrate-binding protein
MTPVRYIHACLLLCLCLTGTVGHAAPPSSTATLQLFLTGSESGLDPATSSDLVSMSLNENLFDPLLHYDYLARPVKLQGNTAALPEIDASGLTYTFRLKPGVWFTPDPAFKGQPRELVAQDYMYSIKRLYDPGLKSPWLFMFEGKLLGDQALRDSAKSGKFEIDTPIPGLQALDRYTLRIRLQAPEPNMLYYLATTASAALAREVVSAYGQEIGNHPVGTGPFQIGQWRRSHQIELLANPKYHLTGDSVQVPGGQTAAQTIARQLAGQRLPRVARIEIKIMEEPQTRLLSFLQGKFDVLEQLPPALSHMVMQGDQLKPGLSHLQLQRFTPLQTYYMWMNMADPVLGGTTPDKIALRRAISMSYNRAEDLRERERGLAIAAQSPLPPNVIGFDPGYRGHQRYDPQLANTLLDKYGYGQRDSDGMRKLPDGNKLTLTMHSITASEGRLRDEVWRKSLQQIGLRVVFKTDKKSEIIKASRLGQVQMFETNWIADFPDGENFLQLLYGPNQGRANYARFNLPEFNQRYEQARRLAPGPERLRLYREMSQLIDGYAPWVLRMHPISLDLVQPWVKNYLRHPVELTNWRYLERTEKINAR